jgi:hypothetical protein
MTCFDNAYLAGVRIVKISRQHGIPLHFVKNMGRVE